MKVTYLQSLKVQSAISPHFSLKVQSAISSSVVDYCVLKVPFCRTEAFKSSFFNRIVSLWNQLPPDTKSSVSFSIFKTNAVLFFLNQNLILILKPTVLAHGFLHVAALCADVFRGEGED